MNQELKSQIKLHLNMMSKGSPEADAKCEVFLLEEALQHGEYIKTLMGISVEDSESEETRLKSILILKKLINSKSRSMPPEYITFFKSNCIECLCLNSNLKVGRIMCEIVYLVMLKNYPNNWPEIDNQLIAQIKGAPSIDKLFWLLSAYCKLAKVREHSIDQVEIELKDQSVAEVFPKLEEYLSGLLSNPINKQNAMLIALIAKIFAKSVRYGLPLYMMNQSKSHIWMEASQRILTIPHKGSPFEEDLIIGKKWISRALIPFFRKYGKPGPLQKTTNEIAFAEYFTKTFVLGMVQIFTTELEKFDRGTCLRKENKTALNMIRCLTHISKNKAVPNVRTEVLIPFAQKTVLASLLFNENDKECYENNPNEYYRRNDDFLTTVSYREGAINFLFEVFYHSLDKFTELFVNQFSNSSIGPREKEVLYLVLEKLFELVSEEKNFSEFINVVFSNFLSHDLANENGFLVMRCCRVIYRYVSDKVTAESLIKVYEGVCNNLKHGDLPVRCSAGLALNSLLLRKEIANLARPHLKDVLVIFVKLIQEMDNDSLMNSLRGIFKTFKEEIKPFSVDLIKTIVEICMKINKKNKEREEDDECFDEFAFLSGLSSIDYLVDLTTDQDVVKEICDTVWPLMKEILIDMDLDSFEEAINLVAALISKSKNNLLTPLKHICEYFLYGLGPIQVIAEHANKGFVFENEFLPIIVHKSNDEFMEFSSCISSLFRNMIYHHWEFLKSSSDQLGNNYLELLFKCINTSLDYKSEILDSTNKVCLLMLQSTLVLTANKYSPELLTSSPLLGSSVQSCIDTIKQSQVRFEEKGNLIVYQNCLLHNLGVALTAAPLAIIDYLQKNNLTSILLEDFQNKFKNLLTYRVQKALFIGILNLILNRKAITDPSLRDFVSSPQLLSFFNRQVVKLYIYKKINTYESEEVEVIGDMDTENEISNLILKFEKDPAIDGLAIELCQGNIDYEMDVQVLLAFDYDLCDELFEELNEFRVFQTVLEKEKSEGSQLFNEYWATTSPGMQKNLQIALS